MSTDGSDRDFPFFIVGASRSGTTLLRLLLDAHPEIAIPPESHFIVEFYRHIGSKPSDGVLEQLLVHERFREWGLDPEQVRAVVPEHSLNWCDIFYPIYQLYADTQGKRRWGDKTPRYATEIDLLRTIFPAARFIHLIRDGRDVAASLLEMPWFEGSIVTAAAHWLRFVSTAREAGLGAEDYLEVRYETLVKTPEETLRGICSHIGVRYDSQMLDAHIQAAKRIPRNRIAWHGETSQPIHGKKIGSWRDRLSPAEVFVFEHYAGALLTELSYAVRGGVSVRGLAAVARQKVSSLLARIRH